MQIQVVLALSLSGAAFAAVDAGAQTIRGRLVDAVNHTPVSAALVELRDAQDHVQQQLFTVESGTFVFVVKPEQRYTLRIAAIGYGRHAPLPVVVKDESVTVPDIVLTAVIVSLPDLRAMAGKRACGKSEVNPETFGGLLEGAQTALQVMDATISSAQLGFQMQIIHSVTVRKAQDSSVSADTAAAMMHRWPVQSLSADSLQRFGFEREQTPEEGGGHIYYGPDMQVLFADWFLDTHCYVLDKTLSRGDTVVIRFDPAGKPKLVDVSGELVLDRKTLTLRHFSYVHRNLPNGLPDRSAGGDMRFAELSPGLWVPTDWSIWEPLTKTQRLISRPVMGGSSGQRNSGIIRVPAATSAPLVQVVGRNEKRAHLTRIVPLGG